MMTAKIAAERETSPARRRAAWPGSRRGACPTLAAPMQTGDGLLVRLRPVSGYLTPQAFLLLLDAAETLGNGRLDITARGNLQIRGLTTAGVTALSALIAQSGIELADGIAVEMPVLAGLDRSEVADPRPVAARLSTLISERALQLAPKLSIIVDGGGTLHLGGLTSDLRLVARRSLDRVTWDLAIGDGEVLASGAADAMIDAAMAVLTQIAALGPQARARDLQPKTVPSSTVFRQPQAPSPVGRFDVAGLRVLGVAPAFGQMQASPARRLVLAALDQGISQIRLAPGRALLFVGDEGSDLSGLAESAQGLGFVVDARDPALRIDACTGAGGCASGGIETKATARLLLAEAPFLLDGSIDVHVSGCPKGCARPRAAALTLVAVFNDGGPGLGLVADGRASDVPVGISRLPDVGPSLAALGETVARMKQSGESTASCLTRLGPARIAAAFERK